MKNRQRIKKAILRMNLLDGLYMITTYCCTYIGKIIF